MAPPHQAPTEEAIAALNAHTNVYKDRAARNDITREPYSEPLGHPRRPSSRTDYQAYDQSRSRPMDPHANLRRDYYETSRSSPHQDRPMAAPASRPLPTASAPPMAATGGDVTRMLDYINTHKLASTKPMYAGPARGGNRHRDDPNWVQPSGPRRPGEGIENEEQGIIAADPTSNGVILRITLLAAGFIIGPSGQSVRDIMRVAGVDIKSWNESANQRNRRSCRVFVLTGPEDNLKAAMDLIVAAVDRYKELCEGKYAGKTVSKNQRVKGVDFQYQPPPRNAVPQAAAIRTPQNHQDRNGRPPPFLHPGYAPYPHYEYGPMAPPPVIMSPPRPVANSYPPPFYPPSPTYPPPMSPSYPPTPAAEPGMISSPDHASVFGMRPMAVDPYARPMAPVPESPPAPMPVHYTNNRRGSSLEVAVSSIAGSPTREEPQHMAISPTTAYVAPPMPPLMDPALAAAAAGGLLPPGPPSPGMGLAFDPATASALLGAGGYWGMPLDSVYPLAFTGTAGMDAFMAGVNAGMGAPMFMGPLGPLSMVWPSAAGLPETLSPAGLPRAPLSPSKLNPLAAPWTAPMAAYPSAAYSPARSGTTSSGEHAVDAQAHPPNKVPKTPKRPAKSAATTPAIPMIKAAEPASATGGAAESPTLVSSGDPLVSPSRFGSAGKAKHTMPRRSNDITPDIPVPEPVETQPQLASLPEFFTAKLNVSANDTDSSKRDRNTVNDAAPDQALRA